MCLYFLLLNLLLLFMAYFTSQHINVVLDKSSHKAILLFLI